MWPVMGDLLMCRAKVIQGYAENDELWTDDEL